MGAISLIAIAAKLSTTGYRFVNGAVLGIHLASFKKCHHGELLGMPTPRSVLAATAFLMGNGDLLFLAVEDMLVDGQRLEGIGVTPTIEVPFDLLYAAGRDPQLERAVQVLSRMTR